MMTPTLFEETIRYLGIHNATPDAALTALVKQAIERVRQVADKQYVCLCVDCLVNKGEVRVDEHTIHSAHLAAHLSGCESAFLFASTLGADVDRLLWRDTVLKPSLAVAEQAAAAALIEEFSDEVCRKLETELTEGVAAHLRPRFSPGYGDFPLEEQAYILQMLSAHKRIGLTHTESFMLTPSKSITAVIGVAKGGTRCYASGCATCSKTDCKFRKI